MRTRRPAALALLIVTVALCCSGARGVSERPRAAARAIATSGPAVGPGVLAGTLVRGAPEDAAPLRLLFVGASVTSGWFASTADRTYPVVVARGLSLRQRRVRVRVLARPGVLAGEADTWYLAFPSDLIVVQLATNDYFRATPLGAFAISYADVLQRLRATSPRAEIVCMGGWDDPAARNALRLTALEYDQVAGAECAAVSGRYVDLSAVYLDPLNHGPAGRPTFHGAGDVFHPNDRGQQQLASLIVDGAAPAARPAPGPVTTSTR